MRDGLTSSVASVGGPAPFVKWAGGKSRLTSLITERLRISNSQRRYFEPFVGAGAVFFRMRACHSRLVCRISDLNPELVLTYRVVRDDVETLLERLIRHEAAHGEDHYYAVRAAECHSALDRAARFIYLNRTCYNGLYRVNRKGQFNVPMGRYANPSIVQRQRLLAASAALADTAIEEEDFEISLEGVGEGDLVYLDPPYDPLSPTSDFTAYTPTGFGRVAQARLAKVFESLAARGAHVVLSNSDTPYVRSLYEGMRPAPGIDRVTVARAINSKGGRRQGVGEVLIYSREA